MNARSVSFFMVVVILSLRFDSNSGTRLYVPERLSGVSRKYFLKVERCRYGRTKAFELSRQSLTGERDIKSSAGAGKFLADFIAKPESMCGTAGDLWRKNLSRIPTHFGRLVFLASLREDDTGRYSHTPMIEVLGRDLADRTLRHSHHQIFAEWLNFSLSEQKSDLDDYLTASQLSPDALPYRELAPSTAHQVERQLYLTDLETLLELIRFDHGGAFSFPGA